MKSLSLFFTWFILISGVSSAQTPAAAKTNKKEYGEAFFQKDTLHSFKIYFTQCNYLDSLKIYKHLGDSLRNNKYLQANIIVDVAYASE